MQSNKKNSLSKVQIAFYIYQIAKGMKYVYFNKIILGDLKPSNILIGTDGNIKISDFGISKIISDEDGSKPNVDYAVGFDNDKQQYEIQIVDQQNTGRINIGCLWTDGLHEFGEVKENLHVQPQSLTIAAISHPSFLNRYQKIYGLTGTLGEEIERKEIKKIYNVDSFDVPPNRINLRKRTETLIVLNDNKKHKLIISKSQNNNVKF